jgi:hypothetical protein
MRVAAAALVLLLWGCSRPREPMELWYWHHSYLVSPEALAASKARVDRAAAAGYTGVALWDSSLVGITLPGWPAEKNIPYLREFVQYASAKGMQVMPLVAWYGHSNDILRQNPNWAEGQRVVGTRFRVNNGLLEQVKSPAMEIASSTYAMNPWRQYHIHFPEAKEGAVEVMDADNPKINYLDGRVRPGMTDFTFNSAGSERIRIAAQGRFELEETALVYVLRRDRMPLKVYDGPTVYREGSDYEPIVDFRLATNHTFDNDNWHPPRPIHVPPGSRLKEGQEVSMDYYAVTPVYNEEVGVCLTDPDVRKWVADNARAIADIFPKDSAMFLGHDEMRHMNTCVSCRAKKMTAGQLLAWSFGETVRDMPAKRLYVWSDMFDKWANAGLEHFYYVEGSLRGAWVGVPENVTIMNWNQERLRESLQFFAGRGNRQVIAGFYDPQDHNGEAAARRELEKATGIRRLAGMMYTTWADDYSQLENYARGAREQWVKYQDSRPW